MPDSQPDPKAVPASGGGGSAPPPKKRVDPTPNPDDDPGHEGDHQNSRPADGEMDRDPAKLRRIGAIARRIFGEVLAGWNAPALRETAQACEAQVAASCLGWKPLYFDPWDEAEELARRFAAELPEGVQVKANADGLFIFRLGKVEPILRGDPAFYGMGSAWEVIERVSPEHNGELLGYGARSLDAGDAQVFIHAAADPRRLYAGFGSHHAVAEFWAKRRLREIEVYVGDALRFTIVPK